MTTASRKRARTPWPGLRPSTCGPNPPLWARLLYAGLAGVGMTSLAAAARGEPPAGQIAPLEGVQYAPTTNIRLGLNAVLGALEYRGSAIETEQNTALGLPLLNGLSLNLDTRLTIDTSLTGQDLLRLRLRSGNFAPSGFFSNQPTPLTRLDFAFEEPPCRPDSEGCRRNLISINRAYWQIPVGSGIRLSVGPRVMQVDMLPVWPSVYTSSPILELFQRAGAAGAYNRRVGSGFGASWQPAGRWRGLSLAYASVASRGERGDPSGGGLFTAGGAQTDTLQLAYTRPQWNLTATYSRNGQQALLRGTPLASQLAAQSQAGAIHSWSLAGYWQPVNAGWLPSISAGWGDDRFAFARFPVADLTGVRTRSWSVGLGWSDVLGLGNTVSLAVGGPAHVIQLQGPEAVAIDDSGLALELGARILLSDTFSLTPALFWLSRPRGALSGTTSLSQALSPGSAARDENLSVWGALLRGTLRF